MKTIVWIVLVVAVLAIVVPSVLVLTLPAAKVTIQAIGPTGRFVTRTNVEGRAVSGPEWLIGVTNVGRATAEWFATVHTRRSNLPVELSPLTVGDLQRGVLQPGKGVVTNLVVVAGDKIEWVSRVTFYTIPTPFQSHVWRLGFAMPGMRRLPDRALSGESLTSWYPATNATMASSTVTNSL